MNVGRVVLGILMWALAALATAGGLSLSSVEEGDSEQVRLAHMTYLKSSNATEREYIKTALQRSLDKNPGVLLSIKGVNIASFCDGTDIDLDSGLDRKLMVRKANDRINRIQRSSVKSVEKKQCIESLKKFRACAASTDC